MDKSDLNNLKDSYKKLTNEELVDIVFNKGDDYMPEVLQIAKDELKSRDIDENSDIVSNTTANKPTKDKKKFGILHLLPAIIIYAIIKSFFSDGNGTNDNVLQYDVNLTKKVFAIDGSMSLSVPTYFEKVDLQQPGSVLEVGDFEKGVFVRVINESKIEIQDIVEPTLSAYSELLVNDTKNMMVNGKLFKLGKFSVNNKNGVRYRLDGFVNKFEFTYLYNIIETNDNFFVIVAFSTKKNFKNYKDTFIKIIGTFKDTH